MDSYLGKPRRRKSLAGFVGVLMGMVIFSGSALLLPLFALGIILSFSLLWHWIAAIGPAVFSGMGGCLLFLLEGYRLHGLSLR